MDNTELLDALNDVDVNLAILLANEARESQEYVMENGQKKLRGISSNPTDWFHTLKTLDSVLDGIRNGLAYE
mgnify:CR=1 FL=1